MCGIAGFIDPRGGLPRERLVSIARGMADRLAHRGPDDAGTWCDERLGVTLGHRRLSVVDLSHHGHQPMSTRDGRYVLVFNGEIYNHTALRGSLSGLGHEFIGTSDTEVAACAVAQWGLAQALVRFTGMFALAVWDRRRERLFLARDRLGEKPLYYARLADGGFGFASELKALTACPGWRGEIDRDSLAQLLRYAYIPAPYSIYREVYKLSPGCYLEVDPREGKFRPEAYWSLGDIVLGQASSRHTQVDVTEAVEQLDQLLSTTIADKMVADVPLGAFLSGGIDSSTIVALMQARSSRPIKTYSIGFHETGYNEATHAKAVAGYLGTDHTELYLTAGEAMAVVPRLPEIYDEPFADSSQIPTFLVSQLARSGVTVSLSGDGGDELFGGYSRYLVGQETWNRINLIPRPARAAAGACIRALPAGLIDMAVRPVRPLLPKAFQYRQFGQKLHKLAGIWNTGSPDTVYQKLVSMWSDPESLVIGAVGRDALARYREALGSMDNVTERMMFTDTVTYLPDDILVKVDRASMAVSLEVRVPFLDHRVVEYAWSLPPELKLADNEGKRVLREVLYRYVPKALVDRPKMGFGVPVDQWLRGPLKEWAADLLAPDRLKQEGYLEPSAILQKWNAHLSGRESWHYQLWPVLMFQAWKDYWHVR